MVRSSRGGTFWPEGHILAERDDLGRAVQVEDTSRWKDERCAALKNKISGKVNSIFLEWIYGLLTDTASLLLLVIAEVILILAALS